MLPDLHAPNALDLELLNATRSLADALDDGPSRDVRSAPLAQVATLPHVLEWAEATSAVITQLSRAFLLGAPSSALFAHLPLARASLAETRAAAEASGDWDARIIWPPVHRALLALVGVARRFEQRDFARDLETAVQRIEAVEVFASAAYDLALQRAAASAPAASRAESPAPAAPANPYARHAVRHRRRR